MKIITERGFAIYDSFPDSRGNVVQVIESSADPLDCVHVFCKEDPAKWSQPRWAPPHINVEQARRLIAALEEFIRDQAGKGH